MMMARMQGRQPAGTAASPAAILPSRRRAVSMAVNERNNSILVQARPDKMAVIAQVIEAVDIPVNRDDSLLVNLNRMQVYRLAGIEPEPVVKTLMEIGNLDPATRLEVDKKNSAIIAYASLADHVTIRAVVDKLTGSERKFEVIHLRRLAADYVAGTIDFMMGSGARRRNRGPAPYFNPFESSRREAAENTKEFRVDADVEHNRLLLWANPVELAAVEALLVKLGEIPASGSGSADIRVIDGGDAKETQELIERIRRAWPSIAPNALLAPAAALRRWKRAKDPPAPLPALPKDSSTTSPLPSPSPSPAAGPGAGGVVSSGRYAERTGRQASAGQPTDRRRPNGQRTNGREQCPPRAAAGEDHGRTGRQADHFLGRCPGPGPAGRTGGPVGDSPQGLPRLPPEICLGGRRRAEPGGFLQRGQERTSPLRALVVFDDVDSQDDSQDERRLSKRRKLTFISDAETNTILVEGASCRTTQDHRGPDPTLRPAAAHRHAVGPQNGNHSPEVLEGQGGGRHGQGRLPRPAQRQRQGPGRQQQGRDSGRNFVFNYSDSDKTEQKTPKFKGLLSIGIDEISNSLMVSAPGYLFDHVTKMIKELDASGGAGLHGADGARQSRHECPADEGDPRRGLHAEACARSRRAKSGPSPNLPGPLPAIPVGHLPRAGKRIGKWSIS